MTLQSYCLKGFVLHESDYMRARTHMVQDLVNVKDDKQLLSASLIEILSRSRRCALVHCHDEGTMMMPTPASMIVNTI